jgi:hypothetical protein
MIAGSFGQIRPISARDHEATAESCPHGETKASRTERMWQTVTVTSGRIIIAWRVGT